MKHSKLEKIALGTSAISPVIGLSIYGILRGIKNEVKLPVETGALVGMVTQYTLCLFKEDFNTIIPQNLMTLQGALINPYVNKGVDYLMQFI